MSNANNENNQHYQECFELSMNDGTFNILTTQENILFSIMAMNLFFINFA